MTTAREMIDRLDLRPHPEGGHYRETVRLPPAADGRAVMTAILFLLDAGERSHWHRVDAAELWLWHAGAPLSLAIGRAAPVLLGGDVAAGQLPQVLVPAAAWQSAQAHAGWTLVSCVVAPGFDFAGFTLAPPQWHP
jgi:predicted cupin superfamily sugar epimerase